MKLLIVVPRWPKNSFWDLFGFKFPLLSTTLLAALTPPEWEVTIIDESITPIDFDNIPDVVATAMTPLAPRGYEIADEFRKRGSIVIMGGMHPSWMPGETLSHADAVVIGEADYIWPSILKDVKNKRLKRVYKQDEFTNLIHIPIPKRELLPKKGYFFENTIQTTRGCPYNCEFCSVTAIYGGKYRTRPLTDIEKEISSLRRATRFIFFVDDNIVANLKYAKSLFEMLCNYKLRWVSQGPITIAKDLKLLDLMAKSGCHGMFIGFETLSEENLKLMGKRFNRIPEYVEGIKRFHDHGIGVHGSFVLGYDYDDESIFEKILEFANRTKLDGAHLPVLTPFPGTRIRKRLLKEKRIITNDWSKYDMATVVYKPKRLSVEALQEGFWWLNQKFYSPYSIFKRMFTPSAIRRSLIIFGPMNLGHIRTVKKAKRYFYKRYDHFN